MYGRSDKRHANIGRGRGRENHRRSTINVNTAVRCLGAGVRDGYVRTAVLMLPVRNWYSRSASASDVLVFEGVSFIWTTTGASLPQLQRGHEHTMRQTGCLVAVIGCHDWDRRQEGFYFGLGGG